MTKFLNISPDEIIFCSKLLNLQQLTDELKRFRSDEPGESPEEIRKRPRYIVGTCASFGIGMTFSEVFGICLMEPDYKLAIELQLFCRHCRQGNKNETCRSWLLYAKNNEREARILDMNHARSKMKSVLEVKAIQSDREKPIEIDE